MCLHVALRQGVLCCHYRAASQHTLIQENQFEAFVFGPSEPRLHGGQLAIVLRFVVVFGPLEPLDHSPLDALLPIDLPQQSSIEMRCGELSVESPDSVRQR